MYSDHFKSADDFLAHVQPIVTGIPDPLLASRYTGFIAVAGVTVYELAIKEIFCEFGESKHQVLGTFARSFFDKINGRIRYETLHREYVSRFGEKYVRKFKKGVAAKNE